jgi:hypothetical protein
VSPALDAGTCPSCGTAIAGSQSRFCVGCGARLAVDDTSPASVPSPNEYQPAATGVTVRLSNAAVAQSVLGGTMRLPSDAATPPGHWSLGRPPGPEDIVAVYAPLRAVVGGWSGLEKEGWRRQEGDANAAQFACFETERRWFAATGRADNLQLEVRLRAQSEAVPGATRRGFRYRIGENPPIEVVAARWLSADGGVALPDLPLPQLQVMAPPRVPRVSDLPERILELPAQEAERWAAGSKVPALLHLESGRQQRTPAGRGIVLYEPATPAWLGWLGGLFRRRYRVRLLNPYIAPLSGWNAQMREMRRDAAAVGLDIETDAAVEWWLDREGYDGAVLSYERPQRGYRAMVVAFRRSQIVAVG